MSEATTRPVVLLLGAGPNTGAASISQFTSHNFSVVAVSRSAEPGVVSHNPQSFNIRADLSEPSNIPGIFSDVTSHFGSPPTVVIYTAGSRTRLPPTDPLGSSFSIDQFNHDNSTNVTSALLAIHHTILGWQSMPDNNDTTSSTMKTFIYIGNKLPRATLPYVLTYGMHKTAMWHCMRNLSVAYGGRGWKFYFKDERAADGKPAMEAVSGEAAAEEMLKLVKDPKQGPVYYSFVKGVGYRDFEESDRKEVEEALNKTK